MIRAEPLRPTETDLRARARADLRIGLPVALTDADGPLLAVAAEIVSDARLAALTEGGEAELVLTRWRADTLKIRTYDADLARLPIGADMPPARIRAVIDPAGDLASPLKGPFSTLRGGDAGVHRAALALAKSARILPAVVVRRVDVVPEGITALDTRQATSISAAVDHVIAARLPIAASLDTRLHIFRPHDGAEEHYAVEIGTPDRSTPVLARLHSACFTGDVLGSLKCDCGPQLNGALEQMAAAGGGVLCYLNQEGRGIGLANKMRAYALQDQGFDTVEANHRLGFEDDERDFGIGAEILKGLGLSQVRLLTNNPRKVEMLRSYGVAVAERVPLWVGRNAHNDRYLQVKAEKSGHMR